MIYIDDLAVTQCGFRNERQINDMVDFVAKGGLFNLGSLAQHNGKDLRLISVVRFEDGRYFIHDGHHRVAAIYLGGRKHVMGNEYYVTDWKYDDYLAINFDMMWVTPFDPRTEVRIPDYDIYKMKVKRLLDSSAEEARAFIRTSQAQRSYLRARTALTVRDLLAQQF